MKSCIYPFPYKGCRERIQTCSYIKTTNMIINAPYLGCSITKRGVNGWIFPRSKRRIENRENTK